MKSNELFAVIENVAAAVGNAKQTVLSEHKGPDLEKLLEYTYNPFKRYGIAKLPERTAHGAGRFDEGGDTYALLERLITRNLTGNAARDAIQEEINRLDHESSELFKRVLRKDMRAGFSESTTNKVFPKLISEFPYMRCSLTKAAKLNEFSWAEGVYSQEKADGMFASLEFDFDADTIQLSSRQGSAFPMGPFSMIEKAARISMQPDTQVHGELLVKVDGVVAERAISNGILNRILDGGEFLPNECPIYLVWDCIPLVCVVKKGKCETPYKQRVVELKANLDSADVEHAIRLIDTRVVHSLSEAYDHCREMMLAGKEGTIIKHGEATWKDGTSKWQVKLKVEFTVDLKITGIVAGKEAGKNDGRAGSFACESSDGLLEVDVTVKNEALRVRVDVNPAEFIGSIISVTANSVVKPSASNDLHSLFLPRMAEADYRRDKSEADSLARIFEQEEDAKNNVGKIGVTA